MMIPAPTTSIEQAAPARLKMTWEEFLDWLDEDTWAEYVDGEVIVHSPASTLHQLVRKFLMFLIDAYFSERPIGQLLDAPFLMKIASHPNGREPDLLVLLHEHADRLKQAMLDGPADLVVEIISPESEGRDRGEKFVEYEAAGIPEYWLIDPIREAVMFYRLDEQQHYQLVPLDEEGYFHCGVLPGLRVNPAWLWQEPLPNLAETLDLVREMLADEAES